MTDSADRSERHVRQVRLPQVGEQGQARLAAARVVIVGVGATGSHLAETLGRAGVGHLRLVDRDVVELSNLQRQALFTDEDAAAVRPKALAAAEMLRRIDPGLDVEPAVSDLTADNVERLLADADVVLDGTDNFPTRFLVNDVCVRDGRPFVYSGVVGVEGQTLVVRPGGPCLRCYVPEPPPPGSLPTCDTAGVLGSAVTLVTSLAASAAVRLLLGAEEQSQLGRVSVVDAWSGTVHGLELRREPDCPCCVQGRYEFLESAPAAEATVLCGRDAVQLPAESGAVDLSHLAEAWRDEGEVRVGPFMVRLDTPERRVLVFQDGRMIVGNTDDPAVARSIRARLLGA
jgi:adenylyltransferase/sulfurtransferase